MTAREGTGTNPEKVRRSRAPHYHQGNRFVGKYAFGDAPPQFVPPG